MLIRKIKRNRLIIFKNIYIFKNKVIAFMLVLDWFLLDLNFKLFIDRKLLLKKIEIISCYVKLRENIANKWLVS